MYIYINIYINVYRYISISIYERGYIFRDAVFVAPPGTCCNERSRTCWRTPQRAYASESHVSTHDGCCCPATLTAAFQFNAIVNMQYLTFTLSLVYIYMYASNSIQL